MNVEHPDIGAKNNEHVFISDGFIGIVNDNDIDPDSINEGLDSNLQILYDDLLGLKQEVEEKLENGGFNGKDGKDGFSPVISIDKTNDGHKVSIQDDVNVHTFLVKDGEKGKDGVDGKSAYDLAIQEGFDGTIDEWLESLRYDHSDEFQGLAQTVIQKASEAEQSAQSSKNAEAKSKENANLALQSANVTTDASNRASESAKESANSALNSSESARQAETHSEHAGNSANSASASATQVALDKQSVEKTVSDFNTDYEQKVSDFNSTVVSAGSNFDKKVKNAEMSFDGKVNEANTNFDTKVLQANNNFNTNVNSSTSNFNTNAQEKNDAFDSKVANANTQFDAKIQDANAQFDSKINQATTDIDEKVDLSKNHANKAKNEADRAEQAMSAKLDKNQGVENEGKVLSVDEQGNVIPTEFKNGSDNVLTNTVEKQENPHIEDSYETEMRDLKFYGKSKQAQTTGINLFNQIDLLDIDSPNYDKSQSGSGVWWYKIEVKGDVVVSINNKSNNGYLCVSTEPDLSKNLGWLVHGSSANPNGNIVVNNPINNTIYLGVNTTLEKIESMINSTKGIMITDGTTVKPYEPYTGGKPSPSPDYPQEITSIDEVDCTVIGRNLLDEELAKDYSNYTDLNNGYCKYVMHLKPSAKYTFSRKDNSGIGLSSYMYVEGTDSKWLMHNTNSSLNNKQVTITSTKEGTIDIIISIINQQMLDSIWNILQYLQVEQGDKATAYEPYKEQHIHFRPPQPLYSTLDGKIADEVDVVSGVYRYNMEKVFLNGSEEYLQDYQEQSGYYGRFFNHINGNVGIDKKILCNYLPFISASWVNNAEGFCQNGIQIHLKFSNERLGITDDTPLQEKRIAFANYIKQLYESENPLYVVVGVKQKEIPIPQETLERLRKLKTYTGATKIICNTPVSFEYEQSIRIVIDNIIKSIQKQSMALSNVEREVVKNV